MTLFGWWRNSLANLDHSPCSPKTKLFHIEFSDLHVPKEDSIKPRCGVDIYDVEEPKDRISNITTAYMAMIDHGSKCKRCNEAFDYEPKVTVQGKELKDLYSSNPLREDLD
jgi:hypothetical protein